MSILIDERVYGETLAELKPRPIHDDAENERQTAMLERLTSLENPTAEQRMVADVLVTLIEAYEERFALPQAASPLQILRELMMANGVKQKDLTPSIASKGVISQVLSGERPITQGMARKLAARFSVSHTLFL